MSILNSNKNRKIVMFSLDEQSYALYLSAVHRVVQAVEITPLPKAPNIILGIINFQSEIIPVIDIRDRFRLPRRERDLEDLFIIAHTAERLVVLAVDLVTGVYEFDTPQIAIAEGAFPYTYYISGIAKIDASIILITDLEKFLSIDKEILLNKALKEETT